MKRFLCYLIAASAIIATATSCNFDRMALKFDVFLSNLDCPFEIEDGIVCESISLEEDYVVYECMLDELDLTIYDIMLAKQEVREAMYDSLVNSYDADIESFVDMCIECNIGIIYNYIGEMSGDICTIQFEPYELEWGIR